MSLAIGLDMGGTKIAAALYDAAGHELRRSQTPTSQDYRQVLTDIVTLVAALRAEHAQPVSIGLGVAGFEWGHDGTIFAPNVPAISGQKFRADLVQALHQPLALANDGACMVLAEAIEGAAQHANNVFGIILGTGVNGVPVYHKKLLRGAHGYHEWGHTQFPFAPDEVTREQCYCGRKGCIETLLQARALTRLCSKMTGETLTPIEIAAAAATPGIAAMLGQYYEYVARALEPVITTYDPEVIVIAGGLSQLPGLVPAVTAACQRLVFGQRLNTRITLAWHGPQAGLRGAALLGRQLAGEGLAR